MSGATIAVSGGLAAAGYAANRYATNQQLKKQDSDAAAGIMRQAALQHQANADVQKGVVQTAQDNSANLAKNQQAEQQQYAAALQRAAPTQAGAFNNVPGGSKRYAEGVTAAIAGNKAFGANQARDMSITDAPSLTNMQTQESLGDTATKLGQLGDTSSNINNLTQMQVKSEQANPWLQSLGAVLNGAASGYGSYAGSKGPKSYPGTDVVGQA